MDAVTQSDGSHVITALTRYGFVSIATGAAIFVATVIVVLSDARHPLPGVLVPALALQGLAVGVLYLRGRRLLREEVGAGEMGRAPGGRSYVGRVGPLSATALVQGAGAHIFYAKTAPIGSLQGKKGVLRPRSPFPSGARSITIGDQARAPVQEGGG